MLEYILGRRQADVKFWQEELEDRKRPAKIILHYLKSARVVIYTLGVTPAFFSKATGEFVPHNSSVFKSRNFVLDNTYRMTSVEENLTNLTAIFELIREASPQAKLVLTVSPVPLGATFERESAIVADCVSKSTLRVVAEEFCKRHTEDVVYWPSFEMVKWVSPHREPFFGIDDGISVHVGDAVVSEIVGAFLKKCLVKT